MTGLIIACSLLVVAFILGLYRRKIAKDISDTVNEMIQNSFEFVKEEAIKEKKENML